MSLHRLDNASWGFDSNCFVCEESNLLGLRLQFWHDDEAGTVSSELNLPCAYSGAPSYIHGGIVLAVMDEAMAWAAIALAHAWALTRQTTATFLRPVLVDRPHTVVAQLAGTEADGSLRMAAQVWTGLRQTRGPSGEQACCAHASATFAPISAEQAASAIGVSPGDSHQSYLSEQEARPGNSH